ncbi:hypothetical protein [Xanthomonas oryzae pv. oryzae MAFF 311018]|nr:hypothetical protein [Xanthomonas oryzae pv. oryzae MAFF 311018]
MAEGCFAHFFQADDGKYRWSRCVAREATRGATADSLPTHSKPGPSAHPPLRSTFPLYRGGGRCTDGRRDVHGDRGGLPGDVTSAQADCRPARRAANRTTALTARRDEPGARNRHGPRVHCGSERAVRAHLAATGDVLLTVLNAPSALPARSHCPRRRPPAVRRYGRTPRRRGGPAHCLRHPGIHPAP